MGKRVGRTYAYVLTHVTHEGRNLIYEGRLEEFGLLANGQFSYLVLSDAKRGYLRMEYSAAYVDSAPHVIGSARALVGLVAGTQRVGTYFVIAGSEIANVIFDRLGVPPNPAVARDIRRSVALMDRGELRAVYRKYGVKPPPERRPANPSELPPSLDPPPATGTTSK